jgi:hypothetical protein
MFNWMQHITSALLDRLARPGEPRDRAPRDDPAPSAEPHYEPTRRRTGDPFDEAGIVGHLRGGYSFRGGRR